MPALEYLSLNGNNLQGAIPPELDNLLTSLVTLFPLDAWAGHGGRPGRAGVGHGGRPGRADAEHGMAASSRTGMATRTGMAGAGHSGLLQVEQDGYGGRGLVQVEHDGHGRHGRARQDRGERRE
jgi:hypothetical protein